MYQNVKKIFGLLLIFFIQSCFAEEPVVLRVVQVPITVNGKQVKVFDILQENGQEGYETEKGKEFNVLLKNQTQVPIAIHWHGLILPNNQDGVAYITQLPIKPGESMHYHFPLVQSGTYWMHSHDGFHEQALMAAPLIINDPNDSYKDYKSVTVMLQDFSFRSGEQIFDDLRNQSNKSMKMDMSSMEMQPDLNDVKYDAYLANRHTLDNPEMIKVQLGEKIRLRIINASAATNYWIDLDKLSGKLIAIDGQEIQPITKKKFQIAIAQRLDILITIPNNQGIYPVFAQVEGLKKRSGILLVTPLAKMHLPEVNANQDAPALNDDQEKQLHAINSLADKPITKTLNYSLEGDMQKYIWTINHEQWPHAKPLTIKKGDRVEMIFTNNTSMSHPMHLHGHVFQVIKINNQPLINGPMHDTILVAPHSSKTVLFDADNPGIWPMHCHVLYHMEAGMFTTTNYENYPEPVFYKSLLSK